VNTAEGSERPKGEARSGAYTQINFLFPPSAVDLPSADKFKDFPPEAQQAILAAFRIEQTHRHQWVTNQQAHDHELNMLRQKHAFIIRVLGLIAALAIVLVSLGFGAWLIQMGQTIWGVAILLASIAGLIGTAIYGHKARNVPQSESTGAKPTPVAPEIEKI
jgi:uncharacterized membrane protein